MADPLDEHYSYLSDRVKIERYESVIARLVQPGHVVLDLGCGSGLLGLMALRAGAGKVYFVEEGSIVDVARRTVASAGLDGRAEFFQESSFELELPERVDIILCDHVGYFGFDYGILELLADARGRFLKPEGIVVPAEIRLQLALAGGERCHSAVGRWQDGSVPEDFAWLASTAANSKHAVEFEAAELASGPIELASLTLGEPADEFKTWSGELECRDGGPVDGLLGWFNCRLHGDVWMSNAPNIDDALDRPQAFFPLEAPVELKPGELARVTVMARHLDNVIAWVVELPDRGVSFSQTTFNGLLLDRSALDRSRQDRVARLNRRGQARHIVLSYCDGKRSIAEVEALVLKEHPNLLPSRDATQALVRKVLAWDTSE